MHIIDTASRALNRTRGSDNGPDRPDRAEGLRCSAARERRQCPDRGRRRLRPPGGLQPEGPRQPRRGDAQHLHRPGDGWAKRPLLRLCFLHAMSVLPFQSARISQGGQGGSLFTHPCAFLPGEWRCQLLNGADSGYGCAIRPNATPTAANDDGGPMLVFDAGPSFGQASARIAMAAAVERSLSLSLSLSLPLSLSRSLALSLLDLISHTLSPFC